MSVWGGAVERLVAMGFTAERARCGLAQGFSSVEEAVGFLVAEGAADDGLQSVLAAAAAPATQGDVVVLLIRNRLRERVDHVDTALTTAQHSLN